MKVLIPENLSIQDFIKVNPPKFEPFHPDRLAYIIGQIPEAKTNNKKYFNKRVPLSSERLKRIVFNYNQYLNYCAESGILVTDLRYSFNTYDNKCRTYDFSELYMDCPLKDYKLTQYKLIRAINRELEKEQQERELLMKKYPFLKFLFDVEIDHQKARDKINRNIKRVLTYNYKTLKKWCYCSNAVEKIVSKEIFISESKTTSRIYNSIGNVKRSFRQYLSYNGQSLYGVDISNCQLLLLSVLFRKEFYQKSDTTFNIYNLSKSFWQKTTFNPIYKYLHIQGQEGEDNEEGAGKSFHDLPVFDLSLDNTNVSGFPTDYPSSCNFTKYNSLVSNGGFFEYVIDTCYEGRISRKEAKKRTFSTIYSDPSSSTSEIKTLLSKTFPGPFNWITFLKSKDYKLLARLMQTIEADIMLNRVCKRIHSEHPKMFFFPVHDCIVTTKKHSRYVESIIIEEVEKAIGLKPKVKAELWK